VQQKQYIPQKPQPPNLYPFYKGNKEAFRKRYPQYYDAVIKSEPYPLEKSKTNLPNIVYNGRKYYNEENPLKLVEETLRANDLRLARLVICLGFGLGYDPLFYTEHISGTVNTEWMLVIEKDPALIHTAMKFMDLRSFFEQTRITLMLNVPEDHMFSTFADWMGAENRYYNGRSYEYIYNMSAMEDPYYGTVIRILSDAIGYSVNNYGNCVEDSMIGTENMFKNIPTILSNPGVNLLKDKFKGVPAVVVATGPSLDKNKHLLKGIEDKALIIACDASLKILVANGYKSHLVATLEREMAIVQLFEGLTAEQVEDVYLMACPVVYPEVYKSYPGKNIIVYRKFDHFKWLKVERGMLDIKYSSGNMSFKIAEYLGCDPIILIGQDLALAAGKTNADGTTLGTEQESYLNEEHMMVQANSGGMIETTYSLNLFLQAYNIDVKAYKGKCINATEGGAYISGTELMTFQEAIDKHVQKVTNPLDIIKKSIRGFIPDTDVGIRERRQHAIAEFERMIQICQDGYDTVLKHKEELKGDVADERMQEILKDILYHKQNLQKDMEVWQLLYAHVGQSYFLNFELEVRHLPGKCRNTLEATTKAMLMHEEYYEVMGGIMKVMLKMLKENADV
jgi:hypothetical protein